MPSFHLFGKPFKPADYPKTIASFAIVLLGALMGIIFQNNLFENYLISLNALTILVPALLLIGIIALVARLRGKKIGPLVKWSAAITSSAILAIVVFTLVWGKIDYWNNLAVTRYVTRAVSLLDQMKAQYGSYPSELSVALFGEPPFLLREYGEYSSDGKEFKFVYVDVPADRGDGKSALVFISTDRKWAYAKPADIPK